MIFIFDLFFGNTEAVKELYDQILQSVVVKRSMAPNAWLWSLIGNCKNHDDIKLLFDVLQNLRQFVSFFSHRFIMIITVSIFSKK